MFSELNYTIIIPHKNIPHLLKRCLDSIPERDDVQIIIVDDNSSKSIVDFNNFPGFGRKNLEILFTKEGKGAGYARNMGLKKAAGKWIVFADADDFFNYCFNDILNEYADSMSDVIYFGYNRMYSDDYQGFIDDYTIVYNNFIKEHHKKENVNRYNFEWYWSPWAKIINKNIINTHTLTFEETPISNDALFGCMLLILAQNIAFDKRALYCYTLRENSIQSSHHDYNLMLVNVSVSGRCACFLKKHNHRNWNVINYSLLILLKKRSKQNYCKAISILADIGFSTNKIILYKYKYFVKHLIHRIIRNVFPPFLYKQLKN